ncbi:YbaN family protein [Notoacmeibacter marinus]|uniref:YbaN family protein n=1 Tax=Notoacmeibacter marinus TaxID=1876515 RepID=UPI000DF42D62|nr:YbaN family protein [Notoacmeibacter marinus]
MRWFWRCAGLLALAFGLVGVVLPLLPTVPFLILAAFCFARSSPRLHDWLVAHPRFGPPIADWRREGAISLRAKRLATVSIAAVFALAIMMGLDLRLLAVQGLTLLCVLLFIWTRPHGNRLTLPSDDQI